MEVSHFFFLGAIDISAAQLDHAGKYTCTAWNAAGSAYKHITLHVQGEVGTCMFLILLIYIFSTQLKI